MELARTVEVAWKEDVTEVVKDGMVPKRHRGICGVALATRRQAPHRCRNGTGGRYDMSAELARTEINGAGIKTKKPCV